MQLTFIGNGNMAKALIKGLVANYKIEVLGRNKKSLEELKKDIPNITIDLLKPNHDISNKNIILCVKPYSLNQLSLSGEANSLYSVLAGTTLESLKQSISSKAYVRTMPNLAASNLKSMTTITGDESIKQSAIDIFNAIGTTLWLKTQKEIDIATGLAGSGPAFLALVAEGLEDGAVNAGLTRADAKVLSAGLFNGFASLLQNEKASNIKDGVMSPGGTTAAGYSVLEKHNVRYAMIEAIQTAYEKAIALGKK